MLPQHLLLVFLWILYCVLHSVLASLVVKEWAKGWMGKSWRYYRLFYTVFAAVSLVAMVAYQLSVRSKNLFAQTLLSYAIGGLFLLAGLVLMGICIRKYFLSLSGLKSLYEERPSAELMIAGVHRYMRHPLYTGTFSTIWGLWICFPTVSLLISNTVITAYTLFAIQLEERKLVTEFGDAYRSYQQSVPKLIPRF